MATTDPKMISEDSAKLARIERLIQSEEERIEALSKLPNSLADETTLRRWLAARGRLRYLVREAVLLHTAQL
jgi:hypothetical protein